MYNSLEDSELQRLASSLPRTVLASRADSTTKKYLYGFMKWKVWAEHKKEVQVFPGQDLQFALYLQHIGETTGSKAAVGEAVNAASWALQLASRDSSNLSSHFCVLQHDGPTKATCPAKTQKEPITVKMLSAMVKSASDLLTDVRLCVMALLVFTAFLHCGELIKLRCCDVEFKPDRRSISGGGPYRITYSTCPVVMLERYFLKASLNQSSSDYLFLAIVATKFGECLRKSRHLSYTRIWELMLDKIAGLGYDAGQFGMHCFCAVRPLLQQMQA